MKSSVDRKIRYRFFCCCCCSPFQYLQSHLLLFMEVVAFVCLLATNQFRCKNSISQYMYKCVCVCVSHRNRNAYWALCERFTRLQSTNESNNKKTHSFIHSHSLFHKIIVHGLPLQRLKMKIFVIVGVYPMYTPCADVSRKRQNANILCLFICQSVGCFNYFVILYLYRLALPGWPGYSRCQCVVVVSRYSHCHCLVVWLRIYIYAFTLIHNRFE